MCRDFQLHENHIYLFVHLHKQVLYLVQQNHIHMQFPVSTSRYGAGCRENSNQTPLGAHRITEKIGAGCREGEIIKARVPTGKVAKIIQNPQATKQDYITTRILWLKGMEFGRNQGKGVDSYHRYIYIHGTPEEGLIGQPASIGCIRMKNRDIVNLFDRVALDTLVYISE